MESKTKFIQNVQEISVMSIFKQCLSPKAAIFSRNTSTKKSSVGEFYTFIQQVHSESFAQIALKISVKRGKAMVLMYHLEKEIFEREDEKRHENRKSLAATIMLTQTQSYQKVCSLLASVRLIPTPRKSFPGA